MTADTGIAGISKLRIALSLMTLWIPRKYTPLYLITRLWALTVANPFWELVKGLRPTMRYCAFVAEPVMVRPRKVVKPHELYEPPKNYGAKINTLIELLEAGKLWGFKRTQIWIPRKGSSEV